MAHPDLLDPARSALLVVDLQERLVRAMPEPELLVARAARLVRGADLFAVPVVATEQVPDKLGPTVAELGVTEPVAKTCFTAWSAVAGRLGDAEQIVVCGVEAHVCVTQTVFDVLAAGRRAYVVADAVASRSESDKALALERLRVAGAVIVPSESVLFEWLGGADAPQFREVQRLVR